MNTSWNSSSPTDLGLTRDDPLFWRLPTPTDCRTVRIIGIFLCIASFVGIILNGTLLLSFIRYQALRTPPNIFIMFISMVGLLASCINLPASGTSSVFCYWLYSRPGCELEGLIAFLYGCSSCYLLCTVSLSRCYIVIRPFNAKDVTVGKCVIVSCLAVLIALVWTILPLVGWNEYTLDRARTSCCTNLYDRRRSFVAFNLCIFVFVYCIPLIILVAANSVIYMGLKRMREKIAHGAKAELSQRRVEMERRILKSIVITIFGFIFTWTPYAIAFFISAFSNNIDVIHPLTTFVCSCFAKTSVVWIPILYMSTSTQFRLSVVDKAAADKLNASTTGAGDVPNAVTARKPDKSVAPVVQDVGSNHEE